jgi:dolichyl-phosphate-mannose--protein O-mannosyl transferase
MTRTLRIIVLAIALLFFGGMTIFCVVALMTYKHMSLPGWVMFALYGYSTWITFRYLRSEISTDRRIRRERPAGSN